jgi:hypothetical protein
MDTSDNAASVPPGELSAALESLAMQAGCSTGGNKAIGIGASRMAREAAAAAAGGGTGSLGPVGAAALLIGTQQGPLGLSKGAQTPGGLSEITPADEDDPGQDMIPAKYPSDSGNTPPAGAVFFRLAGALAPGLPKTASSEVTGEQQLGSVSSSGDGAAISKVLGKCLIGQVGLLSKLPQQTDSIDDSQGAAATLPALLGAASRSSHASGSSSDAAPPSYAESVGADAHDEVSPHANPFAMISRRIWPVQCAAAVQSRASGAVKGASAIVMAVAAAVEHSRTRQSAALGGMALQGAAAAAVSGTTTPLTAQPQRHEADLQPSAGLTRRTPHASRTTSQSLPAGMQPSIEGLGLLGGSSFNYRDECDGQPFLRASVMTSAGQVGANLEVTPTTARTNQVHEDGVQHQTT